MTLAEQRLYLIAYLKQENPLFADIPTPEDESEQRKFLRSLLNIRRPEKIADEFLAVQDEYLRTVTAQKGITDIRDLSPVERDIYLWQGDITTLKCDAIVNAANNGLTGCYYPNHGCIDNQIHTYAGVQLRLKCAEIMRAQGLAEPTGQAKITPGYNLPCKYIIHTVGPIVGEKLTAEDERLLASCYLSCLKLAEEYNLANIAFCCISTGEFHFPNERAAEIALKTVREYKSATNSSIEVIFNVFKDQDYLIYSQLLGNN